MENRKTAGKRRGIAAILAFFILAFFSPAAGQEQAGSKKELTFFFSATCHECQKVKSELLPGLAARYGDRLYISPRDIAEMGNFKQLFELTRKLRPASKEVKVPSVYFQGCLLVGSVEIDERLESVVRENLSAPAPAAQSPASYDPRSHFRSFTPLAVGVAGLIDGINPCAFTVIVFFVSFLALQGFRRRELVLIGCFFIAGVFLTYLCVGLGLFGIFYKLSAFWWLRTAFNWVIGSLSLLFAAAALADCVKYMRTGSTEGMLLSLPQAVKNRIHAVIGGRYRGGSGAANPRALARLAVTALVTGFLVSLLEAVCTGQMYLPTIIFVLKSTSLKLAAFLYLALYNLMFIVPLAAVLVLAVTGMSAGQFARFMARHFLAVKLSMAALFLLMGVFLLWRGR